MAEKEIVNKETCWQYAGTYHVNEHMELGQLSVARERLDVRHELTWEDRGEPRGRFYKGSFVLDADGTLHTWGSLPFSCPIKYSHHIGQTCGCCGLKG